VSSATLDRLLAGLIAAVSVTGALSLTAGAPRAAWLFVAHDILAALLALAVATLTAALRRYWRFPV
jgi:hypothetical protein